MGNTHNQITPKTRPRQKKSTYQALHYEEPRHYHTGKTVHGGWPLRSAKYPTIRNIAVKGSDRWSGLSGFTFLTFFLYLVSIVLGGKSKSRNHTDLLNSPANRFQFLLPVGVFHLAPLSMVFISSRSVAMILWTFHFESGISVSVLGVKYAQRTD